MSQARRRQKRKKKQGLGRVRFSSDRTRTIMERLAGSPTGLIIPVEFELNIEEGLEPLSDEAVDRIQQEAQVIIEEAGREIEATAKELAPVRTGRLRESIFHETFDVEGLVAGASAPYAAYVEYGTSRMEPQPFLEPAIEEHQPILQEALDTMILEIVAEDAEHWQEDPELELELETEESFE